MLHRVRRLIDNLGPRAAVVNLLLLGLILAIGAVGLSTRGGWVLVALVLPGLVLPRLALRWLVERPRGVARGLQWTQYGLLGLTVLRVASPGMVPPWGMIAAAAIVSLWMGVSFWVFSDRTVITLRALARLPAPGDRRPLPAHWR